MTPQPDSVEQKPLGNDMTTTEAGAAAINTNVRLFDLVRYMRSELHYQELITDDEYEWLCSAPMSKSEQGGSPSPRRLEDYDEVRQQLTKALADLSREKERARQVGKDWKRDYRELQNTLLKHDRELAHEIASRHIKQQIYDKLKAELSSAQQELQRLRSGTE